jgi:hypothetical protein
MNIGKALLEKCRDLILCERCKVSLPNNKGATIKLILTTTNTSFTSCRYAGEKKYCDDCAKVLWEQLKRQIENL